MADKKETAPDMAAKTEPNAPVDLRNLSETEAVDAAKKGESTTTFGYDGFHESSNTPVNTSGGAQGRDPLREAIEDANNPLPVTRVPAVEKGEKAPPPPAGSVKLGSDDVVGEARAVQNKFLHDSKREVMIPADKNETGDFRGYINGAEWTAPRGEWIHLTDDQIHNAVAAGAMPPPSKQFQSSQNQLSPEVLLSKKRNAGK